MIASVVPGTPADQAGLERGDVVVEVNGTDIDDQVGLVSAIGNKRPGDAVTLRIVRGPAEQEMQVTLAERPQERP